MKDVRSIAIYSWLFTSLMTIQWISAIPIIEAYSDLAPDRIELFARIEQLVSPLTLFTQLFLNLFCYFFLVLSSILMSLWIFIYYCFFIIWISSICWHSSICSSLLRVFEYGFNKPSREIIYSQLKKRIDINQQYLLILL